MPNTNVFTLDEINQILDQLNAHPGARLQYIGSRYVPIFGRKGESSIEWDNTGTYEPLTIVLYQGNSFTSRQFVPAGIEITNQEYWANTGNYNAQIEQYRQEVANKSYYASTAFNSNFEPETVFYASGFRSQGDGGEGWYVAVNNDSPLATPTNSGYVAPLDKSFLNVMMLGGYNDGVNSNNAVYEIIENYIASLSGYFDDGNSIGLTVFFPKGEYLSTVPLTIPEPYGENNTTPNMVSNITITGSGKNTTRLVAPSSEACIEIQGAFSTVKNISLEKAAIGLHFLSSAYRSKVQDVIFCECSDSGMKSERSFYLSKIENCYALKCGIGFNIQYGATSLVFSNCYANACTVMGYSFGHGMQSREGLRYSSLISCACDDCPIAYGFGSGTYSAALIQCGAETITDAIIDIITGTNGSAKLNVIGFTEAFSTCPVFNINGANVTLMIDGITMLGDDQPDALLKSTNGSPSVTINGYKQTSSTISTPAIVDIISKLLFSGNISTSPVNIATISNLQFAASFAAEILAVCQNNVPQSQGNQAIYKLYVRCSAGTWNITQEKIFADGSGVNSANFTFGISNGILTATNETESASTYTIRLYSNNGANVLADYE